MSIISRAAADGYACLSSWADLLDRINVFPVPDSDTGTNLRISLAPLQQPDLTQEDLPSLLARSATGNSGNIAAAFLQDFLQAKNSNQLTEAAISGRDRAHQAVLDPKRGTMLDVFSALVIVVPLILPLAAGYGVHPIHLGIIFLANMQIGYCTPPVGMNLFIASYRFDKPVIQLYRATLPFLAVLLLTVLIITYVPWLSMVLLG